MNLASRAATCLLLAGCLLLSSPFAQAQQSNRTQDGNAVEPTTNGQATNGQSGRPFGPPDVRPPPGAGPGAPAPSQQNQTGGGRPSRAECRSIAQALRSYDFLSTLRAALDAAGMTNTLNEKDLTISLLAPTDAVRFTLDRASI